MTQCLIWSTLGTINVFYDSSALSPYHKFCTSSQLYHQIQSLVSSNYNLTFFNVFVAITHDNQATVFTVSNLLFLTLDFLIDTIYVQNVWAIACINMLRSTTMCLAIGRRDALKLKCRFTFKRNYDLFNTKPSRRFPAL